MKIFYTLFLSFFVLSASAQKYALIDQGFATPISFTNNLTAEKKVKGTFPVEKAHLQEFIKALEEIAAKLGSKEKMSPAKNYKMGCTTFHGRIVNLARGDRLDYVLKSTCDSYTAIMHLCDSRLSNESNAYFINTWLKYIKSNL